LKGGVENFDLLINCELHIEEGNLVAYTAKGFNSELQATLLASSVAYSSNLKMETVRSSETPVKLPSYTASHSRSWYSSRFEFLLRREL
jgi:hypothetical protein